MRRVSDVMHQHVITGFVFPWKDEQPVYVVVEEAVFLPIFTTADKLRAMMASADIVYSSIKEIEDQEEFLSSFPPDLRFMLDPHFSPTATILFQELLP